MRLTPEVREVLEVIQEEAYRYSPNEEGWPRHTIYNILATLNKRIERMPIDPALSTDMWRGGYFNDRAH